MHPSKTAQKKRSSKLHEVTGKTSDSRQQTSSTPWKGSEPPDTFLCHSADKEYGSVRPQGKLRQVQQLVRVSSVDSISSSPSSELVSRDCCTSNHNTSLHSKLKLQLLQQDGSVSHSKSRRRKSLRKLEKAMKSTSHEEFGRDRLLEPSLDHPKLWRSTSCEEQKEPSDMCHPPKGEENRDTVETNNASQHKSEALLSRKKKKKVRKRHSLPKRGTIAKHVSELFNLEHGKLKSKGTSASKTKGNNLTKTLTTSTPSALTRIKMRNKKHEDVENHVRMINSRSHHSKVKLCPSSEEALTTDSDTDTSASSTPRDIVGRQDLDVSEGLPTVPDDDAISCQHTYVNQKGRPSSAPIPIQNLKLRAKAKARRDEHFSVSPTSALIHSEVSPRFVRHSNDAHVSHTSRKYKRKQKRRNRSRHKNVPSDIPAGEAEFGFNPSGTTAARSQVPLYLSEESQWSQDPAETGSLYQPLAQSLFPQKSVSQDEVLQSSALSELIAQQGLGSPSPINPINSNVTYDEACSSLCCIAFTEREAVSQSIINNPMSSTPTNKYHTIFYVRLIAI